MRRRERWLKAAGISLFAVLLLFTPVAQAAGVSINVDGKIVKNDVNAIIKQGVMVAPIEDIAELLDAEFTWNAATKTLAVKKNDMVITFIEKSLTAAVAVNGKSIEVMIPQALQIIGDEQLVPLRFLAELLGANVNWNQGLQQVQLMLGSAKGEKGEKGDKGDKGDPGATGATGPMGPSGSAGPQGPQGEVGPAGSEGSAGPAGPQGEAGAVGSIGPEGPQGLQGEAGPAGPQGEAGAIGPIGLEGPQGPQGEAGSAGPAGPTGPQGEAGAAGSVGPAGPQGLQGETGPEGPAGPQGLQGIAGPAGPAGANYTGSGFSASLSGMTTNTSSALTNWNVADPNYSTAGFEPSTGRFTVPETGKYAIKATVNYKTPAAITISLGAGIDPFITVKRISPVESNIVSGSIPILNVNIALVLTMRAPMASAAVTLEGDAYLNAGDVLQLNYEADGMTIDLNFGPENAPVTWSIHQLSSGN